MIRLINKKLANRKGFTLIELLVVLAVLAIIALIAIPNFLGVQAQSRAKADLSSCDSIKGALKLALVAENVNIAEGTVAKLTVKGGAIALENVGDATDEVTGDGTLTKKELLKYLEKEEYELKSAGDGLTEVVFTADENGTITHDVEVKGTKLVKKTTPNP